MMTVGQRRFMAGFSPPKLGLVLPSGTFGPAPVKRALCLDWQDEIFYQFDGVALWRGSPCPLAHNDPPSWMHIDQHPFPPGKHG
ncbi:MAG: hypothetical protein CM15mP120_10810 [Pseudomonadota bacterium]|nr:MAG: hypothetical protein CM15mP120_10810 [Pseudomonadota bacterium]